MSFSLGNGAWDLLSAPLSFASFFQQGRHAFRLFETVNQLANANQAGEWFWTCRGLLGSIAKA